MESKDSWRCLRLYTRTFHGGGMIHDFEDLKSYCHLFILWSPGGDLRVLLGHKSGTSTAQGQQRLMTRGCVWHMLSVAELSGKALFSFLFSFLQFCLWRLWGYMLWARSDFDLCVLCMHFQSESVLRRLSVCLQVTFSAFFRCSKTYFYQLCRWWFDI